MKKTVTLTNCSILTIDQKDHYYPVGNLVIEGNKIIALGRKDEIPLQGQVIDMTNKLIMPGLINTHTHTPSPLLRGMADDLSLMDWLKNTIWPAEKFLTQESCYNGAALSCLEFLQSGVTTFADQYFFSESIAKAVIESGLRGFIAPTVFSGSSPESEDTLEKAISFIEKYIGREEETHIYPCIGPHAPYSCDDKTLKEVAAIAKKYDLITHIHISETADENQQIYQETGLTPTAYLNSMGILDNRVLAAHCIHLNPQDIEIFAKKDVRVSYNPISNLKLVSGIMPLKELWQAKIVISIGTDGAQSNNSLDLLKDLKTGALIQKQHNNDATFCTALQALRMITIEGAKALRMEDQIGSLEVGKLADIIAFDLNSTRFTPLHREIKRNVQSAVVYAADGAKDISDLMVGGEFLLRDGKTLRVNEGDIRSHAQKSAKQLAASYLV